MLAELTASMQRALAIAGSVYLILAAAIATAICLVSFFLARIGVEFFRYQVRRQVVCPETGNAATVRIDAVHAAVSSLLDDPELRIGNCSRWPERKDCGQECLQTGRLTQVVGECAQGC